MESQLDILVPGTIESMDPWNPWMHGIHGWIHGSIESMESLLDIDDILRHIVKHYDIL